MAKPCTVLNCENHFKGGMNTQTKEKFISKWIEMINNAEKSVSIKMKS